ncbi:MAG: amidohydrolase family protein [Pyrinomonadaceae bacterium]
MRSTLFLLVLAAICSFFTNSVSAQSYAITNAKIVTVSGATIDKGTIVIRNGLIDAVGANVTPPADAQVFDATGLTVYPGFIDALTSLGLPSAPARPTGQGGGGGGAATAATTAPVSNSNYPAGLRPEDAAFEGLRAGEAQFEANRNAGITTVLTTGRSGIFNGQSAVINLAGNTVSAMVIKSPFAEHIAFATVNGGYPGSLLGTFSALRQMFYDAQRQQEIEKRYAANTKGMKRPDTDKSLEALFPVINRQMAVVFNANREIEIIRALDLIKEFKLNGIIAGGQEAWKVADRLKAQNVPVLLSLNFPKRTASASAEADPDPLETLRFRAETPTGAAKLAAAGVKFAFQSGGATAIGDFFTNAGKTVEGGLSRDAAIRSMTLGAAEILGVDNRLGSIETGKIANLAIVKGDLFGKDKFVPQVIIDGKVFEQKEPPKPVPGGRIPGGGSGGPTTANIANIGGSYTITIDIPGQSLGATLNFVQQGSTFTGTMVSQLGTTPIKDGKVTAEGFTFAGSVDFGGTALDILVRGTVNGNQISGSVDSPQGTVPFSGTKNP